MWVEVGMSALCMHRIPLMVHVLTVCSEFLYACYNFHMKLLHYRVQQLYTLSGLINIQNAIKWTMQGMTESFI